VTANARADAAHDPYSSLLDTCAVLSRALGDKYYVRVDGGNPHRPLRYIATARRLGTRPYAVITADPAELLCALVNAAAPAPLTASAVDSGTATAKYGQHDVLTAADLEELLAKIRRHYRRDPLEERSST
jgi:hypothetical protein